MQMDYFGKGKKSSLRRISANLCSNTEKFFVHRESLRSFTSTYGKWEQEQDLKRIFFAECNFLMDENRNYGKKITYMDFVLVCTLKHLFYVNFIIVLSVKSHCSPSRSVKCPADVFQEYLNSNYSIKLR